VRTICGSRQALRPQAFCRPAHRRTIRRRPRFSAIGVLSAADCGDITSNFAGWQLFTTPGMAEAVGRIATPTNSQRELGFRVVALSVNTPSSR
jgi:hypothetical protein